jgi:hypothetical protein
MDVLLSVIRHVKHIFFPSKYFIISMTSLVAVQQADEMDKSGLRDTDCVPVVQQTKGDVESAVIFQFRGMDEVQTL